MKKKETEIQPYKLVARPLKWIWIVLLSLLLIFSAIYFLLKLPSVQKYVADKTTDFLSHRFHTKVEIDKVDINLFKGIQLSNFYIEDKKGDTLVYAGYLNADLLNSLNSFYHKEFKIGSLGLEDAIVRLSRGPYDERNNLQELFYNPDAIEEVQDTIKEKLFGIEVNKLTVKNVQFSNIDSFYSQDQYITIDMLDVLVDTFDINNQLFTLDYINLSNPSFFIHKYPLIERSETTASEGSSVNTNSNNANGGFLIKSKKLNVSDGVFALKDDNRPLLKSRLPSFDPGSFKGEEINIEMSDVVFGAPYYGEGVLENLSLTSETFKLESSNASRLYILKNKAGLENVTINTGKSILTDQIAFKYRAIQDWQSFVDKVILNLTLQDSQVAISDLLYWVPNLQENKFFKDNYEEKLVISGLTTGRINLLNARDLKIRLGNEFSLTGTFLGRNLTTPDEAIVNASLDNLSTDVVSLNKLIPGFTPPTNFYKLGNLNFSGRFDGFFQDFVAYGDLTTNLGRADVDMRLNLKEGQGNANYSGKINLFDFNLKEWSDNEDFGNLSMSAVVSNGQGLELNTAYAELGGELVAFDFRGYRYSGTIDGKLEQNLFDGKLSINEQNIDLDFIGNVNLQGDIPLYDFKADIRKLLLKKINLSKDIDDINGQVEIKLKGRSLDDITGSAIGNQLQFVKSLDTLNIETLAIASSVDKKNKRIILFDSDIGSGEISGDYKLTELPDAAIALLKNNYPLFFDQIKYMIGPPVGNSTADFSIQLKKPGPLFSFFTKDTLRLTNLSLDGNLNYKDQVINVDMSVPVFRYKDIKLFQVVAALNSVSDQGKLNLTFSEGNINNIKLHPVFFYARTSVDSIFFDLNTDRILDSIVNVNIAGDLLLENEKVDLSFDQFTFNLLSDAWMLYPNSKIMFGNDYVNLKNVFFEGGDKKIKLSSINDNKGLQADLQELDLFFLNQFINNPKAVIDGNLNSSVSIDNLFTREGVNVDGGISQFTFNGMKMGSVDLNVSTLFGTNIANYDIKVKDTNTLTTVLGQVDLTDKTAIGQVRTKGFPLNFLETFLEGSISNTQGLVNGAMQYSGPLHDLKTFGTGEVVNGATTINFLGTRYNFEEAKFVIKKNFIDFTGAQLRDIRGNIAYVNGGLTHQNFKNLGASCDISSRNNEFVLLNTTEKINPLYYGFAVGREAIVSIQGLFADVKISIDATTAADTKMTLPISYASEARDESFIKIVSYEDFISGIEKNNNAENIPQYSGLTLDMNIKVTPEAEMTILFDPNTGHLLKGRGAGDIQMDLSPSGDITMLGEYVVEKGNYDFALQNFIKKRFTIQEGGSIKWDGDPINATINIAADYKTLRAPLSLFLAEYISSNDRAMELAKQDTDVKLTVFLQEKLLNPAIKFDLAFPNLGGELKTYADNKMAILDSDPVGLNNQVFGLLIFNNFLPYNNPITGIGSSIGSSASVILSEFLSSQISVFASTLVEGILNEQSFLYDVDVALNLPTSRVENDPDNQTQNQNEYGLQISPKFKSDKFEITFEGNYYDQNSVYNQYLAGDFIIDVFLNKDKTLKLRVYAKYDKNQLDPDVDNNRYKGGTGFYYSKDFEKLWKYGNIFKKVKEKTVPLEDLNEGELQNNNQ